MLINVWILWKLEAMWEHKVETLIASNSTQHSHGTNKQYTDIIFIEISYSLKLESKETSKETLIKTRKDDDMYVSLFNKGNRAESGAPNPTRRRFDSAISGKLSKDEFVFSHAAFFF